MAARLGKTVSSLQREITSSEFIEWMCFFEYELTEVTKPDMYAAQIALEVRRANQGVSDPNKYKLEDLTLKFSQKAGSKEEFLETVTEKTPEKTPEERKKEALKNKSIWMTFLNTEKN